MTPPALELIGIEKSFGSIHANRGVSIAFERGSIHGVIGENGAGKSTLMSIAYGLLRPDSGTIKRDGRAVEITGPEVAIAMGIAMVHQHFMLVDRLTVLENVVLGTEAVAGLSRTMTRARDRLDAIARDYGLSLRCDVRVRDLPVAERQAVEILKALYRDSRILILDEPTSVLDAAQAERLFAILRKLRDDGRTAIFVSHKLAEIKALTDRVTVLRQGRVVAESATANAESKALAMLMVGRPVELGRIGPPSRAGAPMLEVRDLRVHDARGVCRVDGIDLVLRSGEVVAVAGVAGSGQSELLLALAGMLPIESGRIRWRSQPVRPADWTPSSIRRRGIAHVPIDPRRAGLVAEFTAADNAILGYHRDPPAARHGWLDYQRIHQDCSALMAEFDVRPACPDAKVATLSGGNQQKLLIGREITRDPDLLLIGEPTQGVDIGAVASIRARLAAMRSRGKAVLLITSDIEQMQALADRILVMSAGRIIGEIGPEDSADEKLGMLMGGIAGTDRAAST
ncbi:MAG TPA: ABC transporter ATP-binding protein [Alphaproteobacteria bacterium]|nr:ABC transporter ATP-binding protein [Alphaproteobacteria bacterium]